MKMLHRVTWCCREWQRYGCKLDTANPFNFMNITCSFRGCFERVGECWD